MDTTTLENWLWEAACSIRGPLDAPKFKDYILPLLFHKRLSDVYEDELNKLTAELGGKAEAQQLARADRGLTHFYIPRPPVGRGTRQLEQVGRAAHRHDEGHRSRKPSCSA
jgi:type I restriction-modification system DNA methylase subunit